MNLENIITNLLTWKVSLVILIGILTIFAIRRYNQPNRKNKLKYINYNTVIFSNIKLPLFFLAIILSVYWGIHITFYTLEGDTARAMKQILPFVTDAKNVGIALTVAWCALKILSVIRKKHSQSTNIRILTKGLQILLIAISVVFVVDALGLNISGILTFGGVGGIAAGLAAKDLLANFFGSLVIALDRPFTVGDKIFSPDKQIAGIVAEVGWRVTKIITYEKRPIYIPNALFATIIVQNDSRISNRRINDVLRVRIKNIEIINIILKEVQKMLNEHDDLDKNHIVLVSVSSIGSHILSLNIYAFAKTTDWDKYRIIRQDILIQTMRIVHSLGGELVFPEATVEVHEKQIYGNIDYSNKLL